MYILYKQMMKNSALLRIPFLTVVTFVFFLFNGCEDPEPEQTGYIPIVPQDIFPELGHDGPYFEAVSYTHLTLPTTPYV